MSVSETLLLRIDGDTKGAVSGIENVNKSLGSLSKETGKATSSADAITNAFGGFSSIIKGGAIGLAASQLISVAKGAAQSADAMIRSAEAIRAAQAAFDAYGLSVTAIAREINGAVSNLEIMRESNRLLSSGVNVTSTEIGILANAAKNAASAVGIDAASAFDRLVDSISKGNTQALKSIGIHVDSTGVMEKYAETIGKTTESLTDLEKSQAVLDAVLRKSVLLEAKSVDTAGSAWSRLAANISNASSAAIDAAINNQVVIGTLSALATITSPRMSAIDRLKADREAAKAENEKIKLRLRAQREAEIAAKTESVSFEDSDAEVISVPRQKEPIASAVKKQPSPIADLFQTQQREVPINEIIANANMRVEIEQRLAEAQRDRVAATLEASQVDQDATRASIALSNAQIESKALLGNAYDATRFAMEAQIKTSILEGKLSAKVFKQALADQLATIAAKNAVLALEQLAIGTGMLFINPAAASSHFQAAGLHTAAAIAAGGTARGFASSAGGGSRSSVGGVTESRGTGFRDVGGGQGESVSRTFVVNVFTNSVYTDRQQLGAMMMDAINAGAQSGQRINRDAVSRSASPSSMIPQMNGV